MATKMYGHKIFEFIKYNVKELMYNNKFITYDELIKAKKDLIEFYYNNLNLKYRIIDCYIIGEDYLEGITKKKDEISGLVVFDSTKNVFCQTIIDCYCRWEIKKHLQKHGYKIEIKYKDEICCICYTNKVSKVFIPCKHSFCDFCAEKLEKDSKKCPVCRTEYFCII